MKTLVVDNYDSFTHNLVHLLAIVNQEEPIVIRNDEISWSELRCLAFDNIVISPGPGRPDRLADFGISGRLIAASNKPIFGVCLGHQGIAAFSGGRVSRAPFPVHGKSVRIRHSQAGLFKSVPSPFAAARYHSLIVEPPLPPELVETAWTEDGLIMALAHRTRALWGVQFHPESIITEHGQRLLQNFRDLTIDRRTRIFRGWTNEGPLTIECNSFPKRSAVWQELARAIDTEAAFVELFAASPSAFWLDSSLIEPGRSRWSYLGDASGPAGGLCEYDVNTKRLRIVEANAQQSKATSIFDYLSHRHKGPVENPPPCPFSGGYAGWFGYELGRACGGATLGRSKTPDALFIKVDRFIAVDHLNERTYVVAIDGSLGQERARRWVDEMAARLDQLKAAPGPQLGNRSELIRFCLDRDRKTYLADIQQCLDWIKQGETYQVCLTNEITTNVALDPLLLYRVLRQINPAPYAAFLRWPGGAVLSASPERFLQVDSVGNVETKPIKGTIARHRDPDQDRERAEALGSSEKDRAENVMIVDLLRNDLSRVCLPGSVVVPKLCDVETYATVHQLVSTVRGRLREDQSIIDLVRATFPGGSMTGAPKIRTLQLIDSLEKRPRGIYSGALGWIGDDGAAELSIVIRTIVQAGGQLSLGAGGGIVAQSSPTAEFEEMLLKARASIRAIVLAATGRSDEDSYTIEGVQMEEVSSRELAKAH
jgi:para-aminobenzoate synthetase